jgi:hypothetical protein
MSNGRAARRGSLLCLDSRVSSVAPTPSVTGHGARPAHCGAAETPQRVNLAARETDPYDRALEVLRMTRLRPLFRRLARRAARLPCQVVRERDFRLVADQVLNLSSGGILVGPADPVLTGERVIVSFRGQAGWVDAEAVVARVVHGRRNGEHSRSLGLCFDALDAASRQALESALQMCVPVPPGQRVERRVAAR